MRESKCLGSVVASKPNSKILLSVHKGLQTAYVHTLNTLCWWRCWNTVVVYIVFISVWSEIHSIKDTWDTWAECRFLGPLLGLLNQNLQGWGSGICMLNMSPWQMPCTIRHTMHTLLCKPQNVMVNKHFKTCFFFFFNHVCILDCTWKYFLYWPSSWDYSYFCTIIWSSAPLGGSWGLAKLNKQVGKSAEDWWAKLEKDLCATLQKEYWQV